MKSSDETARKEVLSKMGIADGSVDLDAYTKSLQQDIDTVMEISKVLRKQIEEVNVNIETTDDSVQNTNSTSLINEVMSGLDF